MKAMHHWLFFVCFALLTPFSRAEDLGSMLFTAGTVITDAQSNEWAWVQWMATDLSLIKNRPMNLYLKQGDATATNLFSLQGRATQVTDPRTINLMLRRGEMLGDNSTNLETAIDSLYADAVPTPTLSLAEKIAALIMGSQEDDDLYNNLVFMGRAHPAISMAIGHGAAIRIPSTGFSTIEVRDQNTVEIIGRVTLKAGAPTILPAPGPIYRVPEDSPMGHLNIRLGWQIPDELKRLSLLQFGFNLYRVTQYAAEKWWGPSPTPTTTELLTAVEQSSIAKKVNRMPIVIDPAGATTNTWYFIDDNDAFEDDGVAFEDGDNYYYFLTALDLLGRDGEVSDAFPTFPCDRMAPPIPTGLDANAVSDYVDGGRTQWIELVWSHDTNDTDTARYFVYRHTSIANMQSNAVYALTNRISDAIIPSPDATHVSFDDHTLGTNDLGITYWYTVRAEDNARCGHNLSGNSAPAFATLRDWTGPASPTGVTVEVQVERALCSVENTYNPTLDAPDNVQLICSRSTSDTPIEWADFAWWHTSTPGTNLILLDRMHFAPGTVTVQANYAFDQEDHGSQIYAFCRVGTPDGVISDWAHQDIKVPSSNPPSPAEGVVFKGDVVLQMIPVEDSDPGPGPHRWGNGPTISNMVMRIPPVEGAESVKVYRRVDGGRRTLIHEGVMDDVWGAIVQDYTGGALYGTRICYYYQLFDRHGNPGPMEFVWCFEQEGRVDLPVPLLSPIDSSGLATNSPGMALLWFCTTPGVERFELAVGVEDGDLPPTFGTPGYELVDGLTNTIPMVINGATNTYAAGFYRTGRIGTTFGSRDTPVFLLESTADLNRDYVIKVRAIGSSGSRGEWSNAEAFRWSTVPTSGPEVPWPAKDLPSVQSGFFHAQMAAVYLADSLYTGMGGVDRVGIRIGELPPDINVETTKDRITLDDVYDPMGFLYHNIQATNQTAFACVLYRYQLKNSLYESVSGDVSQVSPLMENIAYGKNPNTIIYDPFIMVTRKTGSTDPWGLYLLDTQPVVRGARYQYLLLRFDDDTKEMDRIIPVPPVDIP